MRDTPLDTNILFDILTLNNSFSVTDSREYLTHISEMLCRGFEADFVICCELIPDTGGIPRTPLICFGNDLINPEQMSHVLNHVTHTGALGKLIKRWQITYVNQSEIGKLTQGNQSTDDSYIQLLQAEYIKAFAFCPLENQLLKLGILSMYYRSDLAFSEFESRLFEVCKALIETRLGQFYLETSSDSSNASRMATAHTLYNAFAARFTIQMNFLETAIHEAFEKNSHPPTNILEQFRSAKSMLLEALRNLVIEASGDLLVNLRQMTLYEALTAAANALEGAAPLDNPIRIDIKAVPNVIERQPLKLRQLLYTLVLELVGNAVKYGGDNLYVYAELSWQNNSVYLQVIDHGKGFDTDSANFSAHGLGFWEKRINEDLHGTFRIVSAGDGNGTTVLAIIPVIPSSV